MRREKHYENFSEFLKQLLLVALGKPMTCSLKVVLVKLLEMQERTCSLKPVLVKLLKMQEKNRDTMIPTKYVTGTNIVSTQPKMSWSQSIF